MRPQVVLVAAQLVDEVDRWRAAYEDWKAALGRRERLDAQTGRRVMTATRGVGLRRFERACQRRRITTAADAALRARAVRARPGVEAAVADRNQVMAEADAAVAGARAVLAERSEQIRRRGRLGVALTGFDDAELADLACWG